MSVCFTVDGLNTLEAQIQRLIDIARIDLKGYETECYDRQRRSRAGLDGWTEPWTFAVESIAQWKRERLEPLIEANRLINNQIDQYYETWGGWSDGGGI